MMSLHRYRYGNHVVGTRLAFPELPEAPGLKPSIVFELRRNRTARFTTARCVHEWRTGKERVYASLHHANDSFLLHFKRLGRFEVSRDISTISCTPCRTQSTAVMRHLFLDLVMPRVLSLAGEHVLHASAIEHGGRAMVFAGESGAGKSTIAAALGQAPGHILADDCVVFTESAGEFRVSAPYAALRLWEDSAVALNLGRGDAGHRNGKRRFRRTSRLSFAAGPSPLGAICLLDRSPLAGSTGLTRVAPAEALVLLVKSAFKFDITDRLVLEREFRFLSRLVASVPCYRLTLPDSLAELPSLRTLVIDAVQSGRTRRIA